MASMDNEVTRSAGDATDARIARLDRAGTGVLRYGVVFLLVVIGTAKYFAFEARAIEPLVEHSPFLSWMLGERTAPALVPAAERGVGHPATSPSAPASLARNHSRQAGSSRSCAARPRIASRSSGSNT